MTDSTHNHFEPITVQPRSESVGLGPLIAAALIVGALFLAVIKLAGMPAEKHPSLIPFDQPAALSSFTA